MDPKGNIIQILKELTSCFSPSGFEKDAKKVFIKMMTPLCDKIQEDIIGNVICTKKGYVDKKIMLIAHIDEIGLMVKHIEENGYIRFVNIGGGDKQLLRGRNVTIMHNGNPVNGIIGAHPIHFNMNNKPGDLDFSDLWIDIGAQNKNEANQFVSIGDPIRINSCFYHLQNDNVSVGSIDNKSGVALMIALMQQLSEIELEYTLVCVASVHEEVGRRGAITAGFYIQPEIAISLDVTHATDIPSVNHAKYGKISIGDGIVIPMGTDFTLKVQKKLMNIARVNGVNFQIEAIPGDSHADIHNIQVTKCGCMSGALSIPCRYMHSPVETISISDILNGIKLITEFVRWTQIMVSSLRLFASIPLWYMWKNMKTKRC